MNPHSYQLAKELKDAGFPQHNRGVAGLLKDPECTESFSMNQDKDGNFGLNKPHEEVLQFYAYAPTLSELIEACGEIHLWGPNKGSGWYADGATEIRKWHVGSTPEEAVARLWLALNKKMI